MQKVKAFLNSALGVVGKMLAAVLLLITLGVVSVWTVGLVYMATSTSCTIDGGSVVCEFK